MFRYLYIGDSPIYLYNFSVYFESIAIIIYLITQVKRRKEPLGCHTYFLTCALSSKKKTLRPILNYIFAFVELFLFMILSNSLKAINGALGDLLNTGANYFGMLFVMPFAWFALSLVLGSNPLTQMDLVAPILPLMLIFIKIACFTAGCCWGIPWEHGFYNRYHGNEYQVPVQLIEAFWALAIFIFFLFYKKKARQGTLLPLYTILYSATRFCSEFLRHEENVLGPLKLYHLLCIAGVVYGIILWLAVEKYRTPINEFYDKYETRLVGKYRATTEEENEEIARKKQSIKAKSKNKRRQRAKERQNKEINIHSRKL